MNTIAKVVGATALSFLAGTAFAASQNITFQLAATQADNVTPQYPAPGGQGLHAYSYTVEVRDKSCTITYTQTSCTINAVNSGKNLVRVYWHVGGSPSEANVFHHTAFWMGVHPYMPSTVNIPSSNVTFQMGAGQSPGSDSVEFYTRSEHEVVGLDQYSVQGTKNGSNTGKNILNLTGGLHTKVLPMLAGCYSIGTLRSSQSVITAVHHSVIAAESDRAVCVGGFDNDITVTFDTSVNQINTID